MVAAVAAALAQSVISVGLQRSVDVVVGQVVVDPMDDARQVACGAPPLGRDVPQNGGKLLLAVQRLRP